FVVPVNFMDSIGAKMFYLLLVLDSNLKLTDTFDFRPLYDLTTPDGKTGVSFGSGTETMYFLPTGSLIYSAFGGYIDPADSKVYQYQGVGKGNRLSGYRPTQVYFPPKSDTGDYIHSSRD